MDANRESASDEYDGEESYETDDDYQDQESIDNGSENTYQDYLSTSLTYAERTLDLIDFTNFKIFGNNGFRHGQRYVIENILSGRDCFILMPTGSGKSLCFQIPAVISTGITIVISPLLSLIQDQVTSLINLPCGGVPTTFISSSIQSEKQARCVFKELYKNNCIIKLLYITPECLEASQALRNIVIKHYSNGNIARLVLDEAHCVSMWGHDFRPAYKNIGQIRRELLPDTQIVTFTATANSQVKSDILKTLNMEDSVQFQTSFFRSNLKFIVVHKTNFNDTCAMCKSYINHHGKTQSGIVYCFSRDESEALANYLMSNGIQAHYYNAGLSAKHREAVQNAWQNGTIHVIVATIAFGMGIDNPNVRYVIHFTMSKSVEGYFQEAGRAGRDGKYSECVLFYNGSDIVKIKRLISSGTFNRSAVAKDLELVDKMGEYCKNNTDCRHSVLLQYFGEKFREEGCEQCCDICITKYKKKTLYDQCPWMQVSAIGASED